MVAHCSAHGICGQEWPYDSHSISRQTRKLMKELFFHLLHLSVLDTHLPNLLGFKTISKFQTCLGQGPNRKGRMMSQHQTTPQGRPPYSTQLTWLYIQHSEHLPSEWRKQSVMYVFCTKQKDKDKMKISEMQCGVSAWGCLRHWIAYLKTVLHYTLVKLEHRC